MLHSTSYDCADDDRPTTGTAGSYLCGSLTRQRGRRLGISAGTRRFSGLAGEPVTARFGTGTANSIIQINVIASSSSFVATASVFLLAGCGGEPAPGHTGTSIPNHRGRVHCSDPVPFSRLRIEITQR